MGKVFRKTKTEYKPPKRANSALSAIQRYCYTCAMECVEGVVECKFYNCELYPYRMGLWVQKEEY